MNHTQEKQWETALSEIKNPTERDFARGIAEAAHSEGFKEGVEKAVVFVDKYFEGLAVRPLDSEGKKLEMTGKAITEALRDLLAQDVSSKKE